MIKVQHHAIRHQDIDAAHRVVGHESKCQHIHGHRYRFHFMCVGNLDKIGRVIDFGVIKNLLCEWLIDNWDHRFLVWDEDPMIKTIDERLVAQYATDNILYETWDLWRRSVVRVPFNPTAENIANYLLTEIAPHQLMGTAVECISVRVDETDKCSAAAFLDKTDNLVHLIANGVAEQLHDKVK